MTGGGWIISPTGRTGLGTTYICRPTLTGKANFGFVSKYQKGANVPTGNTEFQFKEANLNFKSTNYEWLVVQAPRPSTRAPARSTAPATTASCSPPSSNARRRGQVPDQDLEQAMGAIVYDNKSDQAIAGGSATVVHKA